MGEGSPGHDRVSHKTKPLPHTVFLIFFEVFQDRRHLPASHMVLPDVSLEDRCNWQGDGRTARSQGKAHLLEEGGIARITPEPLEVRVAFYL